MGHHVGNLLSNGSGKTVLCAILATLLWVWDSLKIKLKKKKIVSSLNI